MERGEQPGSQESLGHQEGNMGIQNKEELVE